MPILKGFRRFQSNIVFSRRGMPTPCYHNIRVTLLKGILEDTNKFVDSFRSHWKRSKCTIMSDFWTNEKGRSLINFLVNCPQGTIFLKSIDASEHVKDAQLIVKMINEVIEDVGEENIVQFVTNNESNFKVAGKILEEQHPQMFWTPCTTYCLYLMIRDIEEKVLKIKSVLTDARAVVVYIYNHGRILNMIRRLAKNRELHRSCVPRSATHFYTIQSIYENRHYLQVFFVSEQWRKSDFAKKAIGKRIERIIAKQEFWDNINLACQVLAPLVDVVHLVDTEEKPCMGYIYDAMEKAKDQIKKNLTGTAHEKLIIEVWSMIQARWSDQLHHPLHAAGYYLNPSIYYVQELEVEKNRYIKTRLYEAIDRLVRDEEKNDTLRSELDKYIDSKGQFGSAAAIRNRAKVAPLVTEISNLVPGSNYVQRSGRSSVAPFTSNRPIKKKVASADRRAMLESFVNKYRAMNMGKFPPPTTAQKEVGGSYYLIKKMIQEMEYNFKISSVEKGIEKENKEQTKGEDLSREITIEPSGSQEVSTSQITTDQQLYKDVLPESVGNFDTNFELKEGIQPSTSSATTGNSTTTRDDTHNIATESHDRGGPCHEKPENNVKHDSLLENFGSESKGELQHDGMRNIMRDMPERQKDYEFREKPSIWENLKSLATNFINVWKK